MSQISTPQRTGGFTIIELLLAMSGISFLLLFIVFGVVHVTGLYTKGMAIRDINQVGRQLMEDVTREVRYGSGIRIAGTNRICIGNKSYIWNPGSATDNRYDDPTHLPDANPPVTFVVADGTTYCDNPTSKVPTSAEKVLSPLVQLQEFTVTQPDAGQPVYDLRMVFSTGGSNTPNVTTVSGVKHYECDPNFGQFCAFGEFTTTVYARRGN